ncbi:Zinc finger CCCH domain-containing protein 24 [Hibiscus syriacus]|uniref:Zinc finger CCCH domain-containing protein 24 n=1 Tax=Hibiscus syriacus TaxID=106335 RepID=A0A6A3ADZ7_HIBSY|nr:Zinc finger CCCH domain-containing protein 24 [Hibiscus syriacus]
MVAATYGSVDVIKLMLTHSAAVNLRVARTKVLPFTVLPLADLFMQPMLLIYFYRLVNYYDTIGHRPPDVIVMHPKLQSMRGALEELLSGCVSDDPFGKTNLQISVDNSASGSLTLSSSPENGSSPSASSLAYSLMASKFIDIPVNTATERKEYPLDPSLPDIKNSIYTTDEFRLFSFKIRPCSRAYSHDWTECPFVHPGERMHGEGTLVSTTTAVCLALISEKGLVDVGICVNMLMEVFECWLHPTQYRTWMCKDGTSCNRRVCFFAHTAEELHPLYVSAGSAVGSPRSAALLLVS